MDEVWDDIAGWWVGAVRDDPGQSTDTHAVLGQLLATTTGLALDLGCGEGQGLRQLGAGAVGVDVSFELLGHARHSGPVVHARLPDLSWVRSAAVDRVFSVGLLDLIADHELFFAETARVARPGGHLVVVINHPVMTSPDSESLVDPEGEILWRWGSYLTSGSLPQLVGDHVVNLFHRPLGVLLTAAAAAGWSLEVMIERGPSESTIELEAGDHGHEQIPTLAGFRWSRRRDQRT